MLATSPKASLAKLTSLAKPKTFKVLIVGHSGVGKTGELMRGSEIHRIYIESIGIG